MLQSDDQECVVSRYWSRNYRFHTTESFIDWALYWNWEEFWACEDVNRTWSVVQDCITEYLDNYCPLEEKSYKDSGKSWMTNKILNLCEERADLMDAFFQNQAVPLSLQC